MKTNDGHGWTRPRSWDYPDSKVHGASMGPIWGRQDPIGPHVGPMNLDIWVCVGGCLLSPCAVVHYATNWETSFRYIHYIHIQLYTQHCHCFIHTTKIIIPDWSVKCNNISLTPYVLSGEIISMQLTLPLRPSPVMKLIRVNRYLTQIPRLTLLHLCFLLEPKIQTQAIVSRGETI